MAAAAVVMAAATDPFLKTAHAPTALHALPACTRVPQGATADAAAAVAAAAAAIAKLCSPTVTLKEEVA